MANEVEKMSGILTGLLDGRVADAPAVLAGNAVLFNQVVGVQRMIDLAKEYGEGLEWISGEEATALPFEIWNELNRVRKVLRALGSGEVVTLPPAMDARVPQLAAQQSFRRLTWRERITGRVQR